MLFQRKEGDSRNNMIYLTFLTLAVIMYFAVSLTGDEGRSKHISQCLDEPVMNCCECLGLHHQKYDRVGRL